MSDKTEAGGMETVATKLKTTPFNCFHVCFGEYEGLRRLPAGTKLYAVSPDSAAIIAQQSEVIELSEDSRLMDEYLKLQRDHDRQAETIAELQKSREICPDCARRIDEAVGVDVSAKNLEIERLTKERNDYNIMWSGIKAKYESLESYAKKLECEINLLRGEIEAAHSALIKITPRCSDPDTTDALDKVIERFDAARAEAGKGSA